MKKGFQIVQVFMLQANVLQQKTIFMKKLLKIDVQWICHYSVLETCVCTILLDPVVLTYSHN